MIRLRSSRCLLLPLVAAVLLLFPGCKPKSRPTPVRTISLGRENFAIATRGVVATGPIISGTLAPKESAVLRAQIAGEVLRTYADEGARVRAGQLLAVIDPRAAQAELASAQSGVINAEGALEVAEREEARLVALFQAGAVAQRDIDNAHKTTVAARATLAQEKAVLVAAQKQVSYTRIISPFDGSVSAKPVSMGDVVQVGTALYTVVDPSVMQLEVSVPAESLLVVHVGQQVTFKVTGIPGSFDGTIARINPTADPVTKQVRVYAEIPNRGRTLVTDLYAEGRITAEQKVALTVPEDAIDRRLLRPAAIRLRNSRVERVDVTLGISDDQKDLVQILSGLLPGDTVLLGAAQEIAPGTAVILIPAPPGGGVPGMGRTGDAGAAGTTGMRAGTTGTSAPGSGGTGAGTGAVMRNPNATNTTSPHAP